MARFTKALRQQIVRKFAASNNGVFSPEGFLAEVRRVGVKHEAYGWFEWNRDEAAQRYQLEQAREFARDLRVTFTVEIVGRNNAITVQHRDAPFVMSPLSTRRAGGGYVLTDPSQPSHMAELCLQAAADLEVWLRRYHSAILYAHGSPAAVERQLSALKAVSSGDQSKAA